MVATLIGICGHVFGSKNFFSCYLFSTWFLIFWAAGANVLVFILRIFLGKMFSLPYFHTPVTNRIIRRQKYTFLFFAAFSVGAAYLLYSSLRGMEGLYYWDEKRLIAGMAIYCVIVFLNYCDFNARLPLKSKC